MHPGLLRAPTIPWALSGLHPGDTMQLYPRDVGVLTEEQIVAGQRQTLNAAVHQTYHAACCAPYASAFADNCSAVAPFRLHAVPKQFKSELNCNVEAKCSSARWLMDEESHAEVCNANLSISLSSLSRSLTRLFSSRPGRLLRFMSRSSSSSSISSCSISLRYHRQAQGL